MMTADRHAFGRPGLADADVLLESWDDADGGGHRPAELLASFPELIAVSITPFGLDGPCSGRRRDGPRDHLASGGLLSLGGYPGRRTGRAVRRPEPARPPRSSAPSPRLARSPGREDRRAGRHARRVGPGGGRLRARGRDPAIRPDGHVRRRMGDVPREAGTGVFPCADGYVSMVAGRLGRPRAWTALTRWLVDAGVEGARRLGPRVELVPVPTAARGRRPFSESSADSPRPGPGASCTWRPRGGASPSPRSTRSPMSLPTSSWQRGHSSGWSSDPRSMRPRSCRAPIPPRRDLGCAPRADGGRRRAGLG